MKAEHSNIGYSILCFSDIGVIVGGVIPPQDYDFLFNEGVKSIFGPGKLTPSCLICFRKLLECVMLVYPILQIPCKTY